MVREAQGEQPLAASGVAAHWRLAHDRRETTNKRLIYYGKLDCAIALVLRGIRRSSDTVVTTCKLAARLPESLQSS